MPRKWKANPIVNDKVDIGSMRYKWNGHAWRVEASGLEGPTGSQGVKGDKGDTGSTGATGPQGAVGATFAMSGTTLNITT